MMRASIVFGLFAATQAQYYYPSTEITQILTTSMTTCSQASVGILQNNQACSQVMGTLGPMLTSNNTDFSPFCSSSCLTVLRSYFGALGVCMQGSYPSLVAQLRTENVTNPEAQATVSLRGYSQLGYTFDFMCMQNERGDYCFNMFVGMSRDLATTGTTNYTSVTDALCRFYYNAGCCMTSLDRLVQSFDLQNRSFTRMLGGVCPSLATFQPPPCLTFGQRALALKVSMSLTGLSCSAYLSQTDTFKEQYMAALKLDLASQGISASYILINTITDANGVCTLNMVIRGETDSITSGFQTTVSTLNSATLTGSNNFLATAPTVGTVSALGTASVSTTYVTGPVAVEPSPASIAAPSALLLVAILAYLA